MCVDWCDWIHVALKSTAIKPHHLYATDCGIFYLYQSQAALRGAVYHLTNTTEGICHRVGKNNEFSKHIHFLLFWL